MSKRKQLRAVPEFRSEDEEREFWSTHSTADYVDWSRAQQARFPNLKPSTRAISLRLPQALLDEIKTEANRLDVPYQSLMKVWLAEKVQAERKPRRRGA